MMSSNITYEANSEGPEMTELHELLIQWRDITRSQLPDDLPFDIAWDPVTIDEAEFTKAEEAFGFALPEDVKDLYRFSNSGYLPHLPQGMRVFPLTQLLRHQPGIPELADTTRSDHNWNVEGFLQAIPITGEFPAIWISAAPQASGAMFYVDEDMPGGWIAPSITAFFKAHIDYYDRGWLEWPHSEEGNPYPRVCRPDAIFDFAISDYVHSQGRVGPWDWIAEAYEQP